MATIRLNNGSVLLKNGSVSCQCCEEDQDPNPNPNEGSPEDNQGNPGDLFTGPWCYRFADSISFIETTSREISSLFLTCAEACGTFSGTAEFSFSVNLMGEVQRQQRTAQWSFTHCQTFSGCDTSVSASVAIPTNTLITLDGDTVAEFQSAGAVVFAGIGVRLASTIAPTGEIEFGFVGAEGFASLTGFGGSAPFGAFDIVNEINKTETASLTNCPP